MQADAADAADASTDSDVLHAKADEFVENNEWARLLLLLLESKDARPDDEPLRTKKFTNQDVCFMRGTLAIWDWYEHQMQDTDDTHSVRIYLIFQAFFRSKPLFVQALLRSSQVLKKCEPIGKEFVRFDQEMVEIWDQEAARPLSFAPREEKKSE